MNLSKLSPIGRSDSILKEELGIEEGTEEYEKALKKYRRTKTAQLAVMILLSATFVTSIAATFGVQTDLVSKIASYLGTTLLILIYTVLNYLSSTYRETFYVRRQLMIKEKA